MQSPHPKQNATSLYKLGAWHLAALDQFGETRELIEGFSPAQTQLKEAMNLVTSTELAMINRRMKIKLTEMKVEKDIRRVHSAAEIIDGMKKGPTQQALFKKGLSAAIQPVGEGQLTAVALLIKNASDRKLLEHEQLAPHFKALKASSEEFATALAERKKGYEHKATAAAQEMIAREDFCTAYSREMGLIRSVFPNSREMQEFFFDTFRKSASGDVVESEDAEEESSAPST